MIIDELDLPRSTVYQLLQILVREGFLVSLDKQHRYALSLAAFEVGAAFAYQQPLARLGKYPLDRLVQKTGLSAHLCVLHGTDVLYVVEARDPSQAPLVTDVGVRLPSHLTASGRAILARLPKRQVRALYPDRASFTTRNGTGPNGPAALNRMLDRVRELGYGFVDDDVTVGRSSVASVITDPAGHPIASIALTFATTEVDRPDDESADIGWERRRVLAMATQECAHDIQERLLGKR
jgi:DNA-binding IclR family transcriptional regulator